MTALNIKPKGSKNMISFYGGCEEFLRCTDHQVILYGGSGAGKTYAACSKLLMLCLKYPGAKALFTRNSYVALVKSGVETFERVCREAGFQIGKKANRPDTIFKLGESKPTEYRFPYARRVDEEGRVYEGESRILIASLSNAKDELGAEYDYIYVNQPELISEDDWQFLTTRANGRRGHTPYPQLFGDPNPEHEQHWINKGGYRIVDGEKTGLGDRWRLIKSVYTDNPTIWNSKLQCFTKEGQLMIERLQQTLNPVMVKRLIEGEWCSHEGLVYGEVWNPAQHVIDAKQLDEYNITDDWDRYWAFDFGFDEPFVWACWVKHPTEELYIQTKLIYMSNRTIMDHVEAIKDATIGEPRPKLAVADRNPESITLLMQGLGVNIISAKKGAGSVATRTNVVYEMLQKNQLKFYNEALIEADRRLLAKKSPIGFENEVLNLRWKPDSLKEERIDGDDHNENAIGYLFSHIKASQRTVPFIWQ